MTLYRQQCCGSVTIFPDPIFRRVLDPEPRKIINGSGSFKRVSDPSGSTTLIASVYINFTMIFVGLKYTALVAENFPSPSVKFFRGRKSAVDDPPFLA
jgi:hypothetical protein